MGGARDDRHALADVEREVRAFWEELWGRRDVEAMVALMAPDFVQRDHRELHRAVGDRDDWAEAMRGWRDMVEPASELREVEVLGADGDLRAYRLLFSGAATGVGGGTFEIEVFIVDRVRDGLRAEADVFDDRAAALSRFEAATGA